MNMITKLCNDVVRDRVSCVDAVSVPRLPDHVSQIWHQNMLVLIKFVALSYKVIFPWLPFQYNMIKTNVVVTSCMAYTTKKRRASIHHNDCSNIKIPGKRYIVQHCV